MTIAFLLKHENKLIWAGRLILGVVFVWSSIDKILHPADFARATANYKLLPEILVNLLAVTLPWLELLTGLLLLFGQWTRASALVVAGLLVVFVVAVSVSLIRGLDIHCGCFNTLDGRKIGAKLLMEDIGLLIVSLGLVLRGEDRLGWKAFLG